MANAFFSDLLSTISERGRTLLRRGEPSVARQDAADLLELCKALLSGRGEASGTAMAREVLDRYHDLDAAGTVDLLRNAGERLRPRPRKTVAGDRELAQPAERHRRQRPSLCVRAAAAGADPPAQPRAGRHQRPGGDARRPACPDEGQQGSGRARPRRRASAVVLVQQGISRAAQDRLVDASEYSGDRSSATRRCTKSATGTICAAASIPPTAAATPSSIRSFADEPLIFVEVALTEAIPTAIAPLLRRDGSRCRSNAPHRRVLFDLEYARRAWRHFLRQFPDQAGGRGAAARIARSSTPSSRCRRCRASCNG